MHCVVIIVLKIESAGQVRYDKQFVLCLRPNRTDKVLIVLLKLNRKRRAKHVRNTIEMKSYQASILIRVAVMAGHRFEIYVWPGHSM